MISLEQIKQLESKVHGAVARIKTLTSENMTLKKRLEQYEARIGELEELISEFKNDQDEIEQGIVAALSQLDSLEDAVAQQTAPSSGGEATPSEPVEEDDAESESENVVDDSDDTPGADEAGEEEQELDIF
jgi:chromosome segregation ATPase